jgi:hypothetical protein
MDYNYLNRMVKKCFEMGDVVRANNGWGQKEGGYSWYDYGNAYAYMRDDNHHGFRTVIDCLKAHTITDEFGRKTVIF